ncbi:MAG: IS21 family transposase [Gammaproteobacteria bacterium]
MLTQEQCVEIRVLSRQGKSIRGIAKELGMSRNTVRDRLREPGPRRYGPRVPRAIKFDPYRAYLEGRIAAAHPRWLAATVLLREIREQGYGGGISQLKELLRPLRPERDDPLVRFETAPGEQLQADFTHIRRGRSPLLAFVATLGYSRASFVRFSDREDAATLSRCITAALEYIGGVPQHLLLDNPTTVVIERDAYGAGRHRFHPQLLSIAEQYGFVPRLCRPYRAKTKGKVERFNRYLKESFVLPLATTLKQAGITLDVDTANAHVGPWLERVANRRLHATTGEIPAEQLVLERAHLRALPLTVLPLPAAPRRAPRMPTPIESLQHPLSVYEQLLPVAS